MEMGVIVTIIQSLRKKKGIHWNQIDRLTEEDIVVIGLNTQNVHRMTVRILSIMEKVNVKMKMTMTMTII